MITVKNGTIVQTRKKHRLVVAHFKRHDDQPDTFRLRSTTFTVNGVGILCGGLWTVDRLREAGVKVIDEPGSFVPGTLHRLVSNDG